MDWEECVICGDNSGALKCPADSKQNNGAEIYRNFLESFQGFKALQSLPASVKFASADTAETFLSHRAKWHKSCYLKLTTAIHQASILFLIVMSMYLQSLVKLIDLLYLSMLHLTTISVF